MNTNFSVNTQPAFQASLKVDYVLKGKNLERIENIQNLFAQKTARYTDTMEISPEITEGIEAMLLKKNKTEGNSQVLQRNLEEIMEELPDEAVAKKLVKLFKSLKVGSYFDSRISKMKYNIKRLDLLSTLNKKKANLFYQTDNINMAATYQNMANQNIRKAESIEENLKLITAEKERILQKIAKGDSDLESSLNNID